MSFAQLFIDHPEFETCRESLIKSGSDYFFSYLHTSHDQPELSFFSSGFINIEDQHIKDSRDFIDPFKEVILRKLPPLVDDPKDKENKRIVQDYLFAAFDTIMGYQRGITEQPSAKNQDEINKEFTITAVLISCAAIELINRDLPEEKQTKFFVYSTDKELLIYTFDQDDFKMLFH